MFVCSSRIPVPVLFPGKKSSYVTWARAAQGGSGVGETGGDGLCEVGRACWLLDWKIPLSWLSCHQLALLSEGRLHCFLFTRSLDPWLIPFACHCVYALYRTASAFLRSTRRGLSESRHDNFCLHLMSEARGDWPNIHVHQCLWRCACESVSARMWA